MINHQKQSSSEIELEKTIKRLSPEQILDFMKRKEIDPLMKKVVLEYVKKNHNEEMKKLQNELNLIEEMKKQGLNPESKNDRAKYRQKQ